MAEAVTYQFFNYYSPVKRDSWIDQEILSYQYFVHVAPDGKHLVPGMLQQSEKPAIGKWLDVANVTQVCRRGTMFNIPILIRLFQAHCYRRTGCRKEGGRR